MTGDPLALWQTRTLRRRVLTPEPVADALAAAGWTALDGYRWRDPEGGVIGWPLAYTVMERRQRRDGAA